MTKLPTTLATTKAAIKGVDDELEALDRKLAKVRERREKLVKHRKEQELMLQLAIYARDNHPAFFTNLFSKMSPVDQEAVKEAGYQAFHDKYLKPKSEPQVGTAS